MNPIKTQSGMSLISTMAAAAIGAIIALSIAQLIVDGLRSQRGIQQRQAVLNVQMGILDFLSSRNDCNTNFLDTLATATTNVPRLMRPNGSVAVDLNVPLENGLVQVTAMSLGNLRRRANAGLDLYRGAMTLSVTVSRVGNDTSGIVDMTRNVELAVVLKGFNGQAPVNEILTCVAVGNDTNNPWISTPDLNIVYQGNNVGIGVGVPSQKLQVNGNVLASSFLYPSDKRLKTNFVSIEDGLSRLSQLNTVQFSWLSSGLPSVGLIAQEIEKVIPTAVSTDPTTNLKAVDYSQITAIAVKAINELRNENTNLKQRLDRLEKVGKQPE